MGLSGNKGEWSEIYVLLHLLGTARLYSANENLELLDENAFFSILSIFRKDNKKNIRYNLDTIATQFVSIYVDDRFINNISTAVLRLEAESLFKKIISKRDSDHAFEINSSTNILNSLHCSKLCASSDDKTDIDMILHDLLTGYTRRCGFSIKSQLGNPPTLLNAAQTTNFRYEVCGMTDVLAEQINGIEGNRKIVKKIKLIEDSDAVLTFCHAENKIFSENMMLVDSRMEEIIGEILLIFYKTRMNKCKDVLDLIEQENPLNFPRKGFYIFKFKWFLCSVALGMMPGHFWDGQDDANGGYIVVKQDGDVLAYHLYNRNRFEDYLLNNTMFETASTSRHHYMTIYKENGHFYLNLNLQIRFINPAC